MPRTSTVISGVGISDIGRRTGIAPLDLVRQGRLTTPSPTQGSRWRHRRDPDPGRYSSPRNRHGIGHRRSHDGRRFRALWTAQSGRRSMRPGGRSSGPPRARVPQRTDDRRHDSGGQTGGSRGRRGGVTEMQYLLAAHAYSAANRVAMLCHSHMKTYGTTREQMGWVAVNARRNASRNPLAVYREPITSTTTSMRGPSPRHWDCSTATCRSMARSPSCSPSASMGATARTASSRSRPSVVLTVRAGGRNAPTTPRWPPRTPPRRCGRVPR